MGKFLKYRQKPLISDLWTDRFFNLNQWNRFIKLLSDLLTNKTESSKRLASPRHVWFVMGIKSQSELLIDCIWSEPNFLLIFFNSQVNSRNVNILDGLRTTPIVENSIENTHPLFFLTMYNFLQSRYFYVVISQMFLSLRCSNYRNISLELKEQLPGDKCHIYVTFIVPVHMAQ